MTQKILTVIFFLLLIVLLTEAGFIFFNKTKTNLIKNPDVVVRKLTAYEQFKKDNIDSYTKLVNQKFTPEETKFYKNTFSMNGEKLYSSLTLQNELDGTIENISFKNGAFSPAAKYDFTFLLKMENYPKGIIIYYSSEDVKAIEVIDQTTPETKILKLSDLKNGDKAKIKETYDLKQFHLIKAEIIKE